MTAARRGLTAALVAAVALAPAGCSDDGPAGPDDLEVDADLRDAAQTAEEIAATPARQDPDLSGTLQLVAQSLSPTFPGVPGAAAARAVPGTQEGTHGTDLRGLRALLPSSFPSLKAASSVVVPDSLRGRTLVWDADAEQYVVDPSRAGAPADGVRFVMYEIDPATSQPALPLSERGFLEIVDEGTELRPFRAAVRAVDTTGDESVVLLDFVSEAGLTSSGDFEARAEGFLSDGEARWDFLFRQEASVALGGQEATLTMEHVLTREGVGTLSVELAGSLAGDAGDAGDGGAGSGEFDETITVTDGDRTLQMSLQVAGDGTLDGEATLDGRTVALVSGTLGQPVFSGPDGGDLGEGASEALQRLLSASTLLLLSGAVFLLIPGLL